MPRNGFSKPTINVKKSIEVFVSFRPSFDCQEIDDLNKQQSLAIACFVNYVDKLSQARNETIVTNPQQRSAWNVANTGRLNHQHARFTFGKAAIPIEVLLRYKAVIGRAPGHHCRHPGTTCGC